MHAAVCAHDPWEIAGSVEGKFSWPLPGHGRASWLMVSSTPEILNSRVSMSTTYVAVLCANLIHVRAWLRCQLSAPLLCAARVPS